MLGLVLLGLGGGLYFLYSGGARDEAADNAKAARATYDDAIANLTHALADARSFDSSLDRNAATFRCLFSGDGNCRGQGGAFLLFEASQPNHPLSHLARGAGTDAFGVACKNFPSPECPLHVETTWDPVCSGASCEATKSARVRAHVTLATFRENEPPLEWSKEFLFTPQLQLSQAAQCARGGGVWAETECLTPDQAAQRRLASAPKGTDTDASVSEAALAPTGVAPNQEVPPPAAPVVYECPNQIVVQTMYYPVQFLSVDRGQVTVPAMSCQAQGAFDTFVFQCVAKSQPTFPNEGQWIQVEAVMAPACDQGGNSPDSPLGIRQ